MLIEYGKAYCAGVAAFKAKTCSERRNPYEPGFVEYDDFFDGFAAAKSGTH